MSTTAQAGLFDAPPAPPPQPREPTLQERFEAFHAANTQVLQGLVRLARELVDRGHRGFSIAMLFEVLRWQRLMATTDSSSPYRLNNSYRSRYARLLHELHPELAGHLELRTLHTPETT